MKKGGKAMTHDPFAIVKSILKEYEDTFFPEGGLWDDSPYPPYTLKKKKDSSEYIIEMAVAGFKEDELDVTLDKNNLIISGNKKHQENGESSDYTILKRGLKFSPFKKIFTIDPYMKVRDVILEDGILRIELYKELPEELKPKKIPIHKVQTVNEKNEGENDIN